MNKLFLLGLLICSPVFAQSHMPVITTTPDEEGKIFNARKSHWLTTFGFEGLKYGVPANFPGERKIFRETDQELWGGRIGVGREIYLGSNFMATTKVEGYYVGTLFTRRSNAGPDSVDIEFAYSKRAGQVFGIDLTQSIGYLIEMKTKNPIMEEWSYLTLEPFLEAGVGSARAYNRISYYFDTGTSSTSAREGYKFKMEDELLNVRIGGGFNLTSRSGHFFYIRGHVNNFDILKRKTEEYTRYNQQNGSTVIATPKNVTIDPVITYAIGGGYKF